MHIRSVPTNRSEFFKLNCFQFDSTRKKKKNELIRFEKQDNRLIIESNWDTPDKKLLYIVPFKRIFNLLTKYLTIGVTAIYKVVCQKKKIYKNEAKLIITCRLRVKFVDF